MPLPTREDEEKVEREIRKIRKRLYDKNLQKYRTQYKDALTGNMSKLLTDFTSWKTKHTDPLKIYQGNTDHWSKMRVKADTDVARLRLKEQSSSDEPGGMKPAAGCTTLPSIWSPEIVKCLQEKSFPEMVRDSLMPDLPGDLSRGRNKYYNKKNLNLPDNIYHTQALDPQHKYWFEDDLTMTGKTKGKKDRNKRPA